MHPNSAIKIVRDLGKEIILASGGAIFGHPHGPTKGALAMHNFAEALGDGLDINTLSQQKGNESLKLLWNYGNNIIINIKLYMIFEFLL